MAGLDPAIHVLPDCDRKDVDARDKPGHDDLMRQSAMIASNFKEFP
jgi:hypothetical protein